MSDSEVASFCDFTGGTPEQARRFLQLTDGNVEQAVELFFVSPDLGNTAPTPSAPAQPNRSSRPANSGNRDAPISVDDDEEMEDFDDDDDIQETSSRPVPARSGPSVEDDEAMARRLQEEMYGGGGSGGGGAGFGEEDVRAPIARTTETLVGPGSDWRDDPNQMNAAIAQQLMERERRRTQQRAGIFNQRETNASIWNDTGAAATNPNAHRAALSRATGGASDSTPKANHLAELFRPPFDLIAPFSFSDARDEGKETEKWILVNVQDPSIFDCQVLNRDIWKNKEIRETIKEHFIFLQYNKDDQRGQEYINYYFANMRDSDDAYPHIGIIDPRTGEQVKTWSGSPGPKASDFLMDLLEFLDRYSLKMEKKNPVQQAKKKEARKDVNRMSEDEMMQMAMQASLANGRSAGDEHKDDDPDALTKLSSKGKAPAAQNGDVDADMTAEPDSAAATAAVTSTAAKDTPFSRISSTAPHTEPTSTDPKETTRIQFRYSGGRVVRRFALSESVQRIYEWLKAEPLDGQAGKDFELIAMGKNLIDALETSISEAGLRNGTVMVEFVDAE